MTLNIKDRKQRPLSDTYRFWGVMTFYERFEQVVSLALSTVIGVIVVIGLWDLAREVFSLLVLGAPDPLDPRVFQTVFGMILTLLIAMEFNHSVLRVLERQEHVIKVRTVILIALLALARKFIVMDIGAIEAAHLAALGFAALALGVVYWLLREREDHRREFLETLKADTAQTIGEPGGPAGPEGWPR